MRFDYNVENMERKESQEINIKKQITIRIDEETIDYFKTMADETGVKYQQLINLYLADCAKKRLKMSIEWARE